MTGIICSACKAASHSPIHPTCAWEQCPGWSGQSFLERFPVAQVDAERGTVRLPEPGDAFGAHITDGVLGHIGGREIGPGHVVLSEERYLWLRRKAGLEPTS